MIMAEKVPADVIFQAIIQNKDAQKHLTDLVNQADVFNAKNSDYDVIKEYIQASGNCQEILQFIKEISTADSQKAYLTLKALYHILIRIASDLHVYIAAGTSIVNEVLSYGMRTVFNFLKSKQKSSRTKIALHLVAAMVALGDQTALQVVAKLDFTNVNFIHLLHRSNYSEEEDVRTSFLNLIVLILTLCNNNVIRQIVEVKGFLNHIFPGINYDRASTVTLVLNTFRAKIVENPNIPKTSKVRLFNDHSLSHVVKLYTWKGPLKNKMHKKRKLGEADQPIAFEVTEEEVSEIRNCAHKFMLALCANKHGIIFNDASLGFSGKNINHTITNVLQSFKNPYSNPLVSEFVISTLKACPDQLRFYLPFLKDSLTPRLSLSWVNAVKFLREIMKSQDPVSALFKYSSKRTVPALLNIAKTFCMLDILNVPEIVEVLSNGHHVLCYYLCCFISNILEQVNAILDLTKYQKSSEILCDASDLLAFHHSFLNLVLKYFPVMKELQNYWCKITAGTVVESDEICNLNNVPIPSLSEELLTIVKVLKLFQSLYLKSGKDFDVDLPQMLSNIKKDSTLLPTEDLKNVYIHIVDILSAQNALALWNKDTTNTPLMFVVELYQAAHKSGELMEAKDIVYKVLLHTKVFDECKWEIDAWLESLEYSKSRHIPFIFDFINEALLTLFQHPNKFLPKEMKTDSTNMMTDSAHTKEEDPSASNIQVNQRQCFSNFVPAALCCLQNFDKKGCQLFVERALVLIMHHQHFPQTFFETVKPYKSVISPSLFSYWEILSFPQQNSVDKIQSLSDSVPCTLDLSGHLRRNFMANNSTHTSVEICSCNLKSLLLELKTNSIRRVIWQILMYMDFETTLILDKGKQDTPTGVYMYIALLQQLVQFLSVKLSKNSESTEDSNEIKCLDETEKEITNESINKPLIFEIMKETLSHPIMVKLFIGTTPSNLKLKDCVAATTKLVLSMVKALLDSDNSNYHGCLLPLKKKVIDSMQNEKISSYSDIDFDSVLETFSGLFTAEDIVVLLESLLSCQKDDQELSSVYLLLKIFLEKKVDVLLSSTCFSSLVSKYLTVSKKSKKILRSFILQLLDTHPEYALLITEDTAHLLVQQKSNKDLALLGKLIDSSDKFRQLVQCSFTDTDAEEQDYTAFIYLTSKSTLKCHSENDSDKNFKNLITSRYWRLLNEYLLNDEYEDCDLLKECSAGKAAGQLLHAKYSVPKKFNSFCKTLLDREVPSPSKMHVLLELLNSWKLYEADANKTILLVLKVACSWLYSTISEEFSCWELVTLIKEVLHDANDLETAEVIDVNNFYSKCLKISLKHENIGKDVLQVLSLLCEKSKEGIMPIQSIYGLVTGHSSFFQVMLSEKVEKSDFKESVIDLLITLTKLDAAVCKENHIGLFLSAYGATMSTVDQKLLFLMKLYADNGVNMATYSPFLWGKPAIGHYSVMSSSQQYLWKQPKLQDVLSLFMPEMIDFTVLNFPLNITLQPTFKCLDIEEKLRNKIYDLRFILHLFANLLAPGCFVHCRKFVDSRVLMLIFSSLSCSDLETRALGYYCLSQFYSQLESENFREKSIWLCLLDSVRNSITSVNPRLPCIITLFLARVVNIFTKPEHPLYPAISKFITVKPFLDITQVPEYFKLFNSIEIEHRIQRQWLLSLIGDGLRTSADFHICEKRYVFNMLQHYYFTSLASIQEKVAILHILCSAVKIQSSSRTLCERGLLLWIQGAAMQEEPEVMKSISLLMSCLQNTIDGKFTFQFTSIHLSLLEKMKTEKGI